MSTFDRSLAAENTTASDACPSERGDQSEVTTHSAEHVDGIAAQTSLRIDSLEMGFGAGRKYRGSGKGWCGN